jgi:hypothetical protein
MNWIGANIRIMESAFPAAEICVYVEWIWYCEKNGMTAHEFLCVSCPLIVKCKGANAQCNELTVILSIDGFTLFEQNTDRADISVSLWFS